LRFSALSGPGVDGDGLFSCRADFSPGNPYSMIISDDTDFSYAESNDGLTWSVPVSIGTFGPIATAYPTAVGLGEDPHTLGKTYYVYFTHLPADGAGWTDGSLRRLTLTCQ
jgi:hypothetical protein